MLTAARIAAALPHDKALHVISGAACALAGLIVAWWAGLAACAAAAVLREAVNLREGGRFDWRDIAATLGGGALVLAAAWLGLDGAPR